MTKEKIHYELELEGYGWITPQNKWVNHDRKLPKNYKWLLSSKSSKSEEVIGDEFDELSAKGIKCTLTEYWQENGVGWYTKEAHSEDQDWFGVWSNPIKKLLWYIRKTLKKNDIKK